MPDGVKVGAGFVEITADTAPFDDGMAQLPRSAAKTAEDAAQAMRAQMARNRLELKDVLSFKGGAIPFAEDVDAKIASLSAANADLAKKIGIVEGVAARQAAALRGAGDAAGSAASRMRGIGNAAATAGAETRSGSANGAMGLLLLTQAIDDAQYGFRALVNNIPGLSMELGRGLGMSTESATKLAGALGLSAVAVNTWVNNWDSAKAVFGDTAPFKAVEDGLEAIIDKALSAGASIINLRDSILKLEDIKALKEQKAQQAEREKGAQSAEEQAKKILPEGFAERGRSFREAVQKYGGGEMLLADTIAKAKALGGTKETQTKREQNIRLAFADALKGNQGAIDVFTKGQLGHEGQTGNQRFTGIYSQNTPEAKAEMARFREESKEKDRLGEQAQREQELTFNSEAARFSKALESTIGRAILANPRMDENALQMRIRKRLGELDVNHEFAQEITPRIAGNLRTRAEEKTQEQAAKTGQTLAQARTQLVREEEAKEKADVNKAFDEFLMDFGINPKEPKKKPAKERQRKERGFEAQSIGLEDFARKITLGSLSSNKSDDYAKTTADAAKKTADLMNDWDQNGLPIQGGIPAVAVGPE